MKGEDDRENLAKRMRDCLKDQIDDSVEAVLGKIKQNPVTRAQAKVLLSFFQGGAKIAQYNQMRRKGRRVTLLRKGSRIRWVTTKVPIPVILVPDKPEDKLISYLKNFLGKK